MPTRAPSRAPSEGRDVCSARALGLKRFARFVRGDDAFGGSVRGTGLSLALPRRLYRFFLPVPRFLLTDIVSAFDAEAFPEMCRRASSRITSPSRTSSWVSVPS